MIDISKKYYKIVDKTMVNHGLKYQDGVNIDPRDFKEEIGHDCALGGGIYFCDLENIFSFTYLGLELCEITLLEDSRLVEVDNKYRADKINLRKMGNIYDIKNFKWVIENGADIHNNFASILYDIIKQNFYDSFLFLLTKVEMNQTIYEKSLKLSARYGALKVLEYLFNNPFERFDVYSVVSLAAKGNHKDIIEFLFNNKQLDNLDPVFIIGESLYSGKLDTVKYLHSVGIIANHDGIEDAILRCARENHMDVLCYILPIYKRFLNSERIVSIAKLYNYRQMLNILNLYRA